MSFSYLYKWALGLEMKKVIFMLVIEAALLFAVPGANAITKITVDENDSRLIVRLNDITCLPLGSPNASCTIGPPGEADFSVIGGEGVVSRFFSGGFEPSALTGLFAVVLTEPGAEDIISDTVSANVTSSFGFVTTEFVFRSDPTVIIDPLIESLIAMGKTVPETGGEQDLTSMFQNAAGMLVPLPSEFMIIFGSDRDPEPMPEPSTFFLFGPAFLALLYARTRVMSR